MPDRDHGDHAGHDHAHDHGHKGHGHAGHTHAHGSQDAAPTGPDAAPSAALFRVPTMDCAAEESEIRRALAKVSGVRGLSFNLGARTVRIDADESTLPAALAALRDAGFDAQPLAALEKGFDAAPVVESKWRLGAALALAIGAELIEFYAPSKGLSAGIGLGMVLSLAAIVLAGASTYRKGWAALLRARFNINALMTVAVTGAFLIGQWPEAAMVMALYAIAELIEARSLDRARNAIKSLLDLAPDTAEVQQADGAWQEVPAQGVAVDQIVRVRRGARIALDGVVTTGNSAVNQAPVTGESIPVDKAPGDPLFAGTINETSMLEMRVTAPASQSTLARIIHAVEEAQGSRAPTQQFVDRFAAVYTPVVFLLAIAVALLAPWLLHLTWWQAIYKALVLLVIACPCALVIATPVTLVSGLAAAARRGIIVKGGAYLEGARNLQVIALDKTGTITEGKPSLVATEVRSTTLPEAEVLRRAALLAAHSDHPVSRAIAAGLPAASGAIKDFTALPGRGTQGGVEGEVLVLGNHRLIEDRQQCSAALEERLAEHERQGRSVTLLASTTEVLALFAVADTIKATSREALTALHAQGVRSVMLTGDNTATALAIATQAGIDDARGDLLPEDKLKAIQSLQFDHGQTGMTGDGINDSPALAQADIGFAMGGAGTDTAMEAADVVIMNDDLRRIPELIDLSRRTYRVLMQNIYLALAVKAVFFVLAVLGHATMWMAVFADMGASLLVVFNGLRLLRTATPTSTGGTGGSKEH